MVLLSNSHNAHLQGGEDIWGNVTNAPDDIAGATHTHGELISFRNILTANDTDSDLRNMTANEAGNWILQHTPSYFQVCGVVLITTPQADHAGDNRKCSRRTIRTELSGTRRY